MPFYTTVFQNTYVLCSCCRYARTRRHWYAPSTWHSSSVSLCSSISTITTLIQATVSIFYGALNTLVGGFNISPLTLLTTIFVQQLVTTVEPVNISSLIFNTHGPVLQNKGNCPHTSTIPSFSNIHRLQQISVGGLFSVACVVWGRWLPSNNLLSVVYVGRCFKDFLCLVLLWWPDVTGHILLNHQLSVSTVHSFYYYESL